MKRRRRRIARVVKSLAGVAVGLGIGVALGWPLPGALVEARARIEARLEESRPHDRPEIVTGQVARLTQLKTSLEKDLADLRASFAGDRKTLEGMPPLQMPMTVPVIDARVAAVKSDVIPNLVLLSVGSDDQVEKGYHFSVYRGSEFIGKVVVEKVLRDSCGCRVLFTKEGQQVLRGDSAGTGFE